MRNMKTNKRVGSWYLTAVGLALCVVSGLFLWLMGRSFLRAREMSHWPQLPCLILKSEVSERKIGDTVAPDYRFSVLYRYDYEGFDFESDRWGLRGSMPRSERESVEELVARYPVGSRQTCWVNPKNPSLAVLQPDSRAAGYSLWFPGLFFLGGVGMIWGAWKKSSPS
jgi:hypothetical protein